MEEDRNLFTPIENHFKSNYIISTSLFTAATRSKRINELYETAAKKPVHVIKEVNDDMFLCTPVLGLTRRRIKRNIDEEIETRMVSSFNAKSADLFFK